MQRRRLLFYVWFISFVLSAVMLGAASLPKRDLEFSISEKLRSIERAWLDAEKNS